jgi:hypothetical protein
MQQTGPISDICDKASKDPRKGSSHERKLFAKSLKCSKLVRLFFLKLLNGSLPSFYSLLVFKGSLGTQVTLRTNHVLIQNLGTKQEYDQYHLDFDPPIDSEKLRMGLLRSALPDLDRVLARGNMILTRTALLEPGQQVHPTKII